MRNTAFNSFFSSDAVDSKNSDCGIFESKSIPSSKQASRAAGSPDRSQRTEQFLRDSPQPPGQSEFEIKRIGNAGRDPRLRPQDSPPPTVHGPKSQIESLITTTQPPYSLESSSCPRPAAVIKAHKPQDGRPKSQASFTQDYSSADRPREAGYLRPTEPDSAVQTLEIETLQESTRQSFLKSRRLVHRQHAGTDYSETAFPQLYTSNKSLRLASFRQASHPKSTFEVRFQLQQASPSHAADFEWQNKKRTQMSPDLLFPYPIEKPGQQIQADKADFHVQCKSSPLLASLDRGTDFLDPKKSPRRSSGSSSREAHFLKSERQTGLLSDKSPSRTFKVFYLHLKRLSKNRRSRCDRLAANPSYNYVLEEECEDLLNRRNRCTQTLAKIEEAFNLPKPS